MNTGLPEMGGPDRDTSPRRARLSPRSGQDPRDLLL